jgi:hypothetical protein
MSHGVFVVSLIGTGFLTGLTWIFFNNVCFKIINRWLGDRGGLNRSIGFVDLVCYLLGVLISGGYLAIVVLAVLWWTNQYPEWRSSKDVLWYGIVGAAVVWRLFKQRN